MGEGFICKPVEPERAQELHDVATEWLTRNGDANIKIVETTLVYSNVQGYFYTVEFESDAGSGMLEIVGENGEWIAKEV